MRLSDAEWGAEELGNDRVGGVAGSEGPLTGFGLVGLPEDFFFLLGEFVELDLFGGERFSGRGAGALADDVDLIEGLPVVEELQVLVVDGGAEGFGFLMGGGVVDGHALRPLLVAGGGDFLAINGEGVVAGGEVF